LISSRRGLAQRNVSTGAEYKRSCWSGGRMFDCWL